MLQEAIVSDSSLALKKNKDNQPRSPCPVGSFFLFFAQITHATKQLLSDAPSAVLSFILIPFITGFISCGVRTILFENESPKK